MKAAKNFRMAMLCIAVILCMSGCATKIAEKDVQNTEAFSEETTIIMVDVVNKTIDEAKEELKVAGFTNVVLDVGKHTTEDEKNLLVTAQSQLAGEKIFADDKIILTCGDFYNLYIDVNSESNLFLSTYDMELYVDDRSLGFVANGKTFTKMIEVAEGKHEFIAYKSGSNDIYASTIIDVMEDMTFKCDISHSNSISFKNISTENSITGTSLDVPNVVGMLLSDAIKRMETIGFSNVREEPFNDIWDRTNWIVVSQGIQAGEK